MNQDASIMVSFLSGMVSCFLMIFVYGIIALKKQKKKIKILNDLKNKAENLGSKKDLIRERLIKAAELARTQLELRAQVEAPSKNALHSRWKNNLVKEIRDMEEEKISVLKSVLDDGFDPLVTIITSEGTKEEVPLSAYISKSEEVLAKHDANADTPIKTDTKNKNEHRFVVYRGGKDDERLDN